MVQLHSASDCLRPPLVEDLPLKCQQLKRGFGECKRGMIDMRKRFRGNMPVEYATMQRADASGEGYQLYAGSPALSTGARVTDGNEEEPRDWREVENEKYRAQLAADLERERKAMAAEEKRLGAAAVPRPAEPPAQPQPSPVQTPQPAAGASKGWWPLWR
jgi:cytochrome c oxidase assembly factor 5